MFEVRIYINYSALLIPVTVARFEVITTISRARYEAIKFAKQVDTGFAVDVINVADEDNGEKAFGLLYHRDSEV